MRKAQTIQDVDELGADQRYLEIRKEAEAAAGPVGSLRMRASGYLNIYTESEGVCRFALVAAHGALWASWYLVCAHIAALFFAATDWSCRLSPREKYRQFCDYVEALKNINKLVMVETFILIRTLREFGVDYAVKNGVPEDLAKKYARAIEGNETESSVLRELYHEHFLWEQERVVSTKLDDAFERFTWPLMSNLCQRPWVWFSYFRVGKSLKFKSFTDQAERVEKGLIAHDRAVEFGVDRILKITKIRLKIFPGFEWLPL
ncbi:MAG: hypothetical protein AAGE61_15025 [Pseudomonadota bacterium]